MKQSKEPLTTLEFEEACLANEDSSSNELEEPLTKGKAIPKLLFCDHCHQLVLRSTLYCHQSEQLTVLDSDEEEFDPMSITETSPQLHCFNETSLNFPGDCQ